MDSEIKTWLYDVLQSIREIESYFEDRPQRFEEYIGDIRTKRAVERDIEIIGEAVNRILKKDKAFQLEFPPFWTGTSKQITCRKNTQSMERPVHV